MAEKNEMYYVTDPAELANPSKVMRFMVMFFKIYSDVYFDIFSRIPNHHIPEVMDNFDAFMRRSVISYPFKSELTDSIKTKEGPLLDVVVEAHGRLVNLHHGYTSLSAINTPSEDNLRKLAVIKIDAQETHRLLLLIAQRIKSEVPKLVNVKVFFTEEEYEKEKVILPPTRRERRKKKFLDTSKR